MTMSPLSFLNVNQFRAITGLETPVSETVIQLDLDLCSERYARPLLGPTVLAWLASEAAKPSPSALYALVLEQLQCLIAWYALYFMAPTLHYRVGLAGIIVPQAAQALPIDKRALAQLRAYYLEKARTCTTVLLQTLALHANTLGYSPQPEAMSCFGLFIPGDN